MRKTLLLPFLPLLTLTLTLTLPHSLRAQTMYFPPIVGSNWDTLQPGSLGWCQPSVDSLYDYLEANNSKAFILLQDGKIVLEKYFGTFTADSLWYWASAGKTLTAMAVGIAQEEGHLSIDDTTSDYLGTGWTSCSPAQEEKITIRHQLTMTSGLDDGVPDVYCTLPSCLQYAADAGTRWAYHNGPYTLLDTVLEVATGMTLNTWINQKIKAQTGMTGIFVPSGYNNVFVSTPRSMARYGLLLLNEGIWDGNPVLDDPAYFYAMTHSSQALNPSYGYLTWLNGQSSFMLPYLQFQFPGMLCPSAPADMYAAIGKNGQLINVVPSRDMVWIRMGNSSDQNDVSITLNDTIWQFINRLGCPATGVAGTQAPDFQISPNPARDRVQVGHAGLPIGRGRLRILDALGREVTSTELDMGAGTTTVELPAGMAAGMYRVVLEGERQRWTRPLVKQ